MINNPPVPPHELHAQSLSGEMTKSSLGVLDTIRKLQLARSFVGPALARPIHVFQNRPPYAWTGRGRPAAGHFRKRLALGGGLTGDSRRRSPPPRLARGA